MAKGMKLHSRILGAFVLIILLITLSLWAFSPAIVRYFAPEILHPLGLQISEESSVRLNPFKASLTISQLELLKLEESGPKAIISDGLIDLNLLALTQNQISFDALEFDTLSLEIVRNPDLLEIGGYVIPQTEDSPDQDPEQPLDPDPTPWSVHIPSLTIQNFSTQLSDLGASHEISLKELDLSGVELQESGQAGQATLRATLNGAALAADLGLDLKDGNGTIRFSADLDGFRGDFIEYLLKDYLEHLSGQAHAGLNGMILLRPAGMTISLTESFLEVQDLTTHLSEAQVRDSSLRLDADSLELMFPAEGGISGRGQLNLQSNGLEFGPSDSTDIYIATEKLTLEDQQFELRSLESFDTQISSILLEGLRLSHPVAANTSTSDSKPESEAVSETVNGDHSPIHPALAKLNELRFEQISLTERKLSIENIDIGKLIATILVGTEQQIENLVLPPASATSAAEAEEAIALSESVDDKEEETRAESETAEQVASSPFSISLASMQLTEPGVVNFQYQGLDSPFSQTITLDKLALAKLDSDAPLNYSQFELVASAGDYTSVDIKGEAAPFAETTNLNMNLRITELELPKISPFIRTAAGFDMSNGQLDSQTEISIVNDIVDGEAQLEIRGLEVDNAGDIDTGSLTENAFIPLNIALAALEDNDGRIELDIPLSGNVNSPQFGLNGFMSLVAQRAALAASKSYLINTFVPYANIVTLTSIAGSYALKPRVDDLLFEPEQTELLEDQKLFSDQLAALLKDKEKTDMKICGFAAITELNLETNGEATPEQLTSLRNSALARATAVKQYLVQEKEIASSRLLLCEAKIDQSESPSPRVEFEF